MRYLVGLFLIFNFCQCFSHSINEARFDIRRTEEEMFIKVVAPTDAVWTAVKERYPNREFSSIQDSKFKERGFDYFKSTIKLWNGWNEYTLRGSRSSVSKHISVFELRCELGKGAKDTMVNVGIKSFSETFEDQLNVIVYRDSDQTVRQRIEPGLPIGLDLSAGTFVDFQPCLKDKSKLGLTLLIFYGFAMALVVIFFMRKGIKNWV